MSGGFEIEKAISELKWATTIGAVCDKFGGEVQTGPFGSQLHASDYSDNGTPVVMPKDMDDGRIVCSKVARVADEHVRRLNRHVLQLGDIVFSRRGDVGRFAIVTEAEVGWLCGTGSIRIRLNAPEIDIRYARRYLQQDTVGKWLKHHAKGVTMPNLNTEVIRKLPFVYPPLDQQRRIAAILDQADELRRKRRDALRQLSTLGQAIFIKMFGDPAANRRGWPKKPLGQASVKFSDGPFGSNLKSAHYVDSGIRVIRLQNIGVGEFIDDDKAFIAPDHFKSLQKHICLPGDVIIGTLGDPNLRACILPSEISIALNKADCVQMRVAPEICTPEYVSTLLNTPSVERMAQNKILGQTRLRISMGRLRELEVPFPPIGLQRQFSAMVTHIKKQTELYKQQLYSCDALFASLQHRAFRGEL